MTRPIVGEHNMETNIYIEREMNDAEFATWTAEQATIVADAAAAVTAADIQATKVAAVNAKLAAIGLTQADLLTLGEVLKALGD
jgi:hypothetical protein